MRFAAGSNVDGHRGFTGCAANIESCEVRPGSEDESRVSMLVGCHDGGRKAVRRPDSDLYAVKRDFVDLMARPHQDWAGRKLRVKDQGARVRRRRRRRVGRTGGQQNERQTRNTGGTHHNS